MLRVTKLVQVGHQRQSPQLTGGRRVYTFEPIDITVEMFADEMEIKRGSIQLPEERYELQ